MRKHEVDAIEIRGARVHNLKNVDLDIPLRKLICFAGPSGSGKTSLAFHTLLTESKRRFVNSFPNSMKFFTERPAAVDVDRIFPVLPVFGLPQINPIVGSRTVVSDVMRLTDSLQNLYFMNSKERCPIHDGELEARSISDQLKNQIKNKMPGSVYHILVSSSDYQRIFGESFFPSRSYSLNTNSIASFSHESDYWEIFRFKLENLEGFGKKWEELKLGQRECHYAVWAQGFDRPVSLSFELEKSCPVCDFKSKPVYSVSAFSPYSALGACPDCKGYGANLIYDDNKLMDKELSIAEGGLKLLNYGPFHDAYEDLLKLLKKKKISTEIPIKKLPKYFFDLLEEGEGNYPGFKELKRYLESKKYRPSVRIFIRNLQREEPCQVCYSSRINKDVHHYKVKFNDKILGLADIMGLTIDEALKIFSEVRRQGTSSERKIFGEIYDKLNMAHFMGLNHLSLIRKAKSLSAGEYQRLLLIKYLSFQGVDSLFILDEPGLGLSEEELKQLLKGLRQLIDQGNTVIVIDHLEQIQRASDHLIVMGPAAGKDGGQIIYQGEPQTYFKTKEKVFWDDIKDTTSRSVSFIDVKNPKIFGKNYPDFQVPLNTMTWVTGNSGTGKTACLIKVLANTLYKKLSADWLYEVDFVVKSIKSPLSFSDIIVISSELNRFTSRSSVGTITELSSSIRKHFLKLPIAKSMSLKEGHLSSNSELGMCPRCEGKGVLTIEMQYLEDIVLECEDCKGLKIKPIYANISDGHMTLAEAYNLPLNQVLERVELTPKFRRVWEYLKILNLDYLSLDRTLNSLSGGEKQRIYLLSKLLKQIENSLLIFENISFGLSERELKMLGQFLRELVTFNNSILIIDSSSFFQHLAQWRMRFSRDEIVTYKKNND